MKQLSCSLFTFFCKGEGERGGGGTKPLKIGLNMYLGNFNIHLHTDILHKACSVFYGSAIITLQPIFYRKFFWVTVNTKAWLKFFVLTANFLPQLHDTQSTLHTNKAFTQDIPYQPLSFLKVLISYILQH
jgi:hypothetical protein